jgi:hypothetical protein
MWYALERQPASRKAVAIANSPILKNLFMFKTSYGNIYHGGSIFAAIPNLSDDLNDNPANEQPNNDSSERD